MPKGKQKVFFAIIVVIILSILLCGCQQTPSKQIVVGKGTESQTVVSTEAPAVATDVDEQSKVKVMWEEMIKGNNFEIDVNAEIPEAAPLAAEVYDVISHSFTQDEANRFVKSILGDIPIFQYADPYSLSKEDIEKKIIEIRQLMADGNKGGSYFYTDPDTGEEFDLPAEEYIERLEKDYNSAPATKEKIYNDTTLRQDGTSEQLYTLAELDNHLMASIFINNNPQTYSNVMQYQANKDRLDYVAMELLDDSQNKINGCSLGKEEALNKAQTLVDAIVGNDSEYVYKEVYVGSYRKPDESLDPFIKPSDDELYDKSNQAFIFCFTKRYGAIDTSYIRYFYDTVIDGLEESYQPIYQSESIEVYINDDGIQYVEWYNPDTIIGSSQRQLLSLDEIKERFREQSRLMNWNANNENMKIMVKKVEFGMMRIAKKDDPNTYQVVPVWDFMGYVEGKQQSNYLQSLLTINAIDGSVINRALNY